MVYVNSTFFLVLLGWSIFSPFVFLFWGWFARGVEEKEAADVSR